MAEENLETATRHGAAGHRGRASNQRRSLLLVDGNGRCRRIPKETEEAECLRRNQRRLRVIDDEADALKEEKRFLHVRRALLSRSPDNQDVVEVKNRSNSPKMKKAFEELRYLGEDEGSETEAERKDPKLPNPSAPAEAKVAAR